MIMAVVACLRLCMGQREMTETHQFLMDSVLQGLSGIDPLASGSLSWGLLALMRDEEACALF
jgi:hypothetical protein